MTFDKIKSHLLNVGYPDNSVTDQTVVRLLSLSGRSFDMLCDWIEMGKLPSFEPIKGVGSEFLIQKLSMRAPALAIAYSMLEDNPDENAAYFKKLANNIVGFYPILKK